MKTVILCGGIGYRLKEETEFRPKPMVQIGGKHILWHIMKIYAHYGFNDFIIALGYKGDYIKQYFLNEKNMVHDFSLDTLSGKTRIIRNGVNSEDFKITDLVKFHVKQGKIGTVTGVHPRSRYGLLSTDKNKRVTSFTEKPVLNERTNGGFMVFKKDFFNYIN